MDIYTSKKLVKDTFENDFDKNRFYYFTKNLLNKFDETKAFHAHGYVKEKFKKTAGIVKTYERLGTYIDPEGNKIDILIVYLEKKNSLDRARTTLRNFVANYLKQRDMKEAALVAFVSPDLIDWRFSLVKMEYKISQTPSGNIKAKEKFTPAKRFSFLVGSEEHTHTAQSRLVPIIQDDVNNPTLKELEDAFSVETVTKEFFEKYKSLFLDVKDSLERIIKKDTNIAKDFADKGVDPVDFSKKLLGQIVFLYFLQKKGWFGVGRDNDWGTGPKNFLRLLFEKMIADYKNFFNDILEPLFYEALAKERDDDFYSRFNCKIPFLNGGLFDPISDYDWVHTDILLPDELFSNQIRTKEGDTGTGILDIFDRYNFTVKEDEPLEKEVAVDPEMLGKVFENLLEVKDRKSKGTYYTPREIVHYMCQESLINYLLNELSSCHSRESGNPVPTRKDIETLIQYGETAVEHDSRVEQEGKETETYSYKLPESVRKNAQLIDDKLKNIRVCDPAIGSGAFPVGMMSEIIRTRNTLTSYLSLRGAEATKQSRSIYNFKRDAIQDSLYGVDIDPGAVEIAKLRLWLSLIVDEEDIKQIKPLPNLDYKIMQGNSLLEEFEGVKLFDEELISKPAIDDDKYRDGIKEQMGKLQREYIQLHSAGKLTNARKSELELELKKLADSLKRLSKQEKVRSESTSLFDMFSEAKKKAQELKQLHKEFFEASQKTRKDEIKRRIENLEWELIETTLREQNKMSALKQLEQYRQTNIKPFFLWRLNFAEVFAEKSGFDIVIANPPYVEHKKLKVLSGQLKKIYSTYSGTADLYVYFYEQGINILKNSGILTYISSNKFIRTSYGERLRGLLSSLAIQQVIDFTKVQVFDALVASCVIVVLKDDPGKEVFVTDVDDEIVKQISLTDYIKRKHRRVNSTNFSSDIWQLEDNKKLAIKEKIEHGSKKFSEIKGINIYRGVTTGYNPAFVIDKETKNKLIEADKRNVEIIKPLLQGRNIRKWTYLETSNYLIFTKQDIPMNNYPVLEEYLHKYYFDLKPRKQNENRGRKPGKYKWYEIQDNTAYYLEFEKEKVIWGLTADKWVFAYDDEKHYLPSNGYILTSEGKLSIKYLLALLNSNLLKFYFGFIGIMTAGGAYTLKHETIGALSIKEAFGDEQKPFIEIVDKILVITGSNDYLTNSEKQTKVRDYEKQIDQLVYKLYGLTPEEIAIVEGG